MANTKKAIEEVTEKEICLLYTSGAFYPQF